MDIENIVKLLVGILDSEFFQSFITLAVGFVALYIYRKQHVDEKRDAAQTIYNEISSAENKLKGIRERFFASENPALESAEVLPYENWNRYKYLFVTDLTNEEWDLVDNFYSNCKTYDEAVRLENSYFHYRTEHIAATSFKYLSDTVDRFRQTNPKNSKDKKMPADMLNDVYDHQDVLITNALSAYYKPKKPLSDARIALVALETNVSLSTSGQKLKHIANPERFFRIGRTSKSI